MSVAPTAAASEQNYNFDGCAVFDVRTPRCSTRLVLRPVPVSRCTYRGTTRTHSTLYPVVVYSPALLSPPPGCVLQFPHSQPHPLFLTHLCHCCRWTDSVGCTTVAVGALSTMFQSTRPQDVGVSQALRQYPHPVVAVVAPSAAHAHPPPPQDAVVGRMGWYRG
uniref:Uncharacterized protein n=1 Tax=Lygus hesperus TaxID=30085 RepID=A0A146M605_LYGHE